MAKKLRLLALIPLAYLLINAYLVIQVYRFGQQYYQLLINHNQNQEIVQETAKKIDKNYQKISKIIKKIILKDWATDLDLIVHSLVQQDHHVLLLLQNSDELRATGGFLGSYSRLDIKQGYIELDRIHDIYEVAGQQRYFPTTSNAYSLYLGEHPGLALQDANWHPDLANSAQDILEIWQDINNSSPYINETDFDHVIFINSQLIEEVLAAIGPLALSDYAMTINADNFTELARAGRSDFFAGSTEKADFLDHFKNTLINQLSQLSLDQQLELAKLILDNARRKNIQFYSSDPKLEAVWQEHSWAGQMKVGPSNSFYFYSVESNVGINKANRLVDRSLTFYQTDGHIDQIRLSFDNYNQVPGQLNDNPNLQVADHLAYINYQRLYFAPQVKVEAVIDSQGKKLDFSTQPFFDHQGEEFLELSFLINLPEQSHQDIDVMINSEQIGQQLYIQKQSGIDQFTVKLINNDQEQKRWTISSDQLQ